MNTQKRGGGRGGRGEKPKEEQRKEDHSNSSEEEGELDREVEDDYPDYDLWNPLL